MAISKVAHITSDNKYILTLEDVYTNIGDTCGISKLTDTAPDGAITLTVKSALAAGIVRRASLRLSNKKTGTAYLTAANASKIGGLQGMTYTGAITIQTARFPKRIRLV